MRFGILSDVHANLHALDAVLAVLRPAGVDAYLCPGDLVGYGPQPDECVERLAELGAVCVAGNHDLIALGRLSDDRCIPLARDSLRWTRRRLKTETRAFLAGLPLVREASGGPVMAHGSLDDPEEYVERPEQSAAQIQRLAESFPAAPGLLLGHTHRPWAWIREDGSVPFAPGEPVRLPHGRRWLLNAGSVGQSAARVPVARCLVLDLGRREATFYAVPYDHLACKKALRAHGLPICACHPRPSGLELCTRGLRRLARGTLGAGGLGRER